MADQQGKDPLGDYLKENEKRDEESRRSLKKLNDDKLAVHERETRKIRENWKKNK